MDNVLTINDIQSCVYNIRGRHVMLDCDLARIYGYEVKRLNEQVKRNISRFPEDFMFELTKEEIDLNDNLKSQFATSSWGGKRKFPYAFTEQGIYMLATVLKGNLAEQQSIFIMRAFKEMRHYILQNQQFASQSDMNILTAKVSEINVRVAGLIDKEKNSEKNIKTIQNSINKLNENFITEKDYKNFVIYKGEKFEADAAYIDIYRQAKKVFM